MKQILTLLLLACSSFLFAQKINVQAYKTLQVSGKPPDTETEMGQDGGKTKEDKPVYQYQFYVSAADSAAANFKVLAIVVDKAYYTATLHKVKSPVVYSTPGRKDKQVVAKTKATVFAVAIAPSNKKVARLTKAQLKNEVVVIYSVDGKTYFEVVKKLETFETAMPQ
jgi:hypothetical protein